VVNSPDATSVRREISRRDNAIRKVVVSDSEAAADQTAPWTDTTRIVGRSRAHKQIAELKRGGGGGILIFGSRTLWNDLLVAGLVDELHLMLGPVVLGCGTPVFGTGAVPPLQLIGTQSFEGSANLVVKYAPQPASWPGEACGRDGRGRRSR
jgi:dihydrofolate reductase